MPTMRFTSSDETKKFYFDSSPAHAVSQKMAADPKRFELRNESERLGIVSWDVYTVGMGKTEKNKPLRKFGTLEYQAPEWPGGPSKPWIR